jgi:hypothetical protein
MADNLSEQLLAEIKSFIALSIAVNESMDVSVFAQLAVFRDLNITVELLAIISLPNTTGEDFSKKCVVS